MDDLDVLKQQLGRLTKLTALVGTFVGVVDGQAFVDAGNGRVPATVLGALPEIAADVHVWFLSGARFPFIMGTTRLQPTSGTVTALDGLSVTVTTVAGTVTLPYLSWYQPVVGDGVKIAWGDVPTVLGVLSTRPATPEAPPPPSGGGGSSKRVDKFTATDSGTYHPGSWWTDEIWASDSGTGAAFYGSKIHNTLAGRTVDLFEVFISAKQIQGDDPIFVTHSSGSKPAGNVSVANSTTKAVENGWVTLPDSLGQWLVDHVGGLGVNHGGYNIFRSINEDRDSFALRFTTH